MPSFPRDNRESMARSAMFWRTERGRSENSTSSDHSSSTTSSGGLYRNLPQGAPAQSQQRVWEAGLSRCKRIWDSDDRAAEPVAVRPSKVVNRLREYLPCFVKPLRSVLYTDEELEARQDEISKKEVWIRPIGFPSQKLEDELEKAELLPLKTIKKAYPILVVTAENQRKRGLIRTEDLQNADLLEYLDVDTGRVEKISIEQVFAPPPALLSIPNAAIRCRLNIHDKNLESKLLERGDCLSSWTRTRVHVVTWACIPTVTLSILETNFDLKPVIEPRDRLVAQQKIQKLYRTLPGILVPPPFTILSNCSVLHIDRDCVHAYIAQNHAPFEIDPSEAGADQTVTPSIRENEQFYIEGDIVCAQYNDLEARVAIEKFKGSAVLVRSVDSGGQFKVSDSRELTPLLKRAPPRALKVTLPSEYYKIDFEKLSIYLKTGVFDVFFENNDDPPAVRLFTLHGSEMNVCVADKIELICESAEYDSDDDRSSTRSCRG